MNSTLGSERCDRIGIDPLPPFAASLPAIVGVLVAVALIVLVVVLVAVACSEAPVEAQAKQPSAPTAPAPTRFGDVLRSSAISKPNGSACPTGRSTPQMSAPILPR